MSGSMWVKRGKSSRRLMVVGMVGEMVEWEAWPQVQEEEEGGGELGFCSA